MAKLTKQQRAELRDVLHKIELAGEMAKNGNAQTMMAIGYVEQAGDSLARFLVRS